MVKKNIFKYNQVLKLNNITMKNTTIDAFEISFLVWQIINIALLVAIFYLVYRLFKKLK
jgi:hypothetical protein